MIKICIQTEGLLFANVRADIEEFMNSTYPEMQANFKRYFGNRHFTPKKYVYITTKKQKLRLYQQNGEHILILYEYMDSNNDPVAL